MTPRATIDAGKMSPAQVIAVVVVIMLVALDGIDIMTISFAASGIASEWKVAPDTLGWVLSMELVGMAVGSVALGTLGDKIGRRKAILMCVGLTAIGMGGVPFSSSIVQLSGWRILTGLGIGGTIASLGALAAEFSNNRTRPIAMTMMAGGYPIGGFLGGLAIKQILMTGNWRDIFHFGTAITVLALLFVVLFIPESPEWLAQRQPPNALERINSTLARFRLPPVSALPAVEHHEKAPMSRLFVPGLLPQTLLITLAFLAHMLTFYFFSKWGPKLIAQMGYTQVEAAGTFAYAMLGGVAGSLTLGFLAMRLGGRTASVIILSGAAVMVAFFGVGPRDLFSLTLVATATMFFCSGGGGAFFVLMASIYPSDIRATGTGFTLGVGRGGAIIGPAAAGYLMAAGSTIGLTMQIMALGSAVAAIAVFLLPLPRKAPEES